MRILDNTTYSFKGTTLLSAEQQPLTTQALLTVIVENSSYQTSPEILKAMKVLARITVNEKNQICLEDEDFAFIKDLAGKYLPIIEKGLAFGEFYQQLETA